MKEHNVSTPNQPNWGLMPQSKSVALCSCAVIAVAALVHLARPACQLHAAPTQDRTIADPKWGQIFNLEETPVSFGDLFTATATNGLHGVRQLSPLTEPGVYRISLDARYDGTAELYFEFGGPGQPSGHTRVNLQTGAVENVTGDILATGVERLSGAGDYRWWVEMRLKPGTFGRAFYLWSKAHGTNYPGRGVCRVVARDFQISRVAERPQ